ncbi:hypothetical protein [Burkholderia multivorans]|uniref:hypothetical protein n=1 Tax=Burkholderia multivorans TaxID=87883 RepID=UPI001C6118BA|nr:hypothetical protein [Burkholderia multivorans]
MHKLLALAALVAVTPALADTCMVSPTEKQTVSGRFGKYFNRAVGVSNYMAEAILRKKERVEALLAMRKQTAAAHDRAQRGGVLRSIQ